MTPQQTFSAAAIWQGTSQKPRPGQRFYVRNKRHTQVIESYVEVVWLSTEQRHDGEYAIMVTQTGEQLEWRLSDVIYRSHRQLAVANTVNLPRELNDNQLNAAAIAMLSSGKNQSAETVIQSIWTAIKQHGGN